MCGVVFDCVSRNGCSGEYSSDGDDKCVCVCVY